MTKRNEDVTDGSVDGFININININRDLSLFIKEKDNMKIELYFCQY